MRDFPRAVDLSARNGALREALAQSPAAERDEIARIFRAEYGRCVATLIRFLGDIDLAEEAVQEAFIAAVQNWSSAGLPPNPGGWITTTARNRLIDRLRRDSLRDVRSREATPARLIGRSTPWAAVR